MDGRILLSPPHLNGYEEKFVKEAFLSNWIAPIGPNVNMFEKEIKEYAGVSAAAALSSGTAGIHLALHSVGVSAGDFVLCSSFTFIASCNPILYQNAIPVFVDSEYDTWNMSPKALLAAIKWCDEQGKHPKAVVIVSLYGQSAQMDKLVPICEEYEIPIIEDAAESLGASYEGKKSGTFGRFGVYSFNGNKIITTSGGGMIVSNDIEAINKIRYWSTQSREPFLHYQHVEVGYNYRMSNICAGIGRGQLITIDERIESRGRIFKRYQEAFDKIPLTMMPVNYKCRPNWWLSGFTIDKNITLESERIIVDLEKCNIESRPFWKPMHMQPLFAENAFFSHLEEGSVCEDLFKRGICLPSGSAMTEEDQRRVTDTIIGTVDAYGV